jgi:hypothetical protein
MRKTDEAVWVAGMHQSDLPRGELSRVGDRETADGGRIVFYTIEQPSGTFGYIVYLDAEGKVRRLE